MKRLCNATNLPEAHLLAGWLSQNGIRIRVLNANAAGALGELPVEAALPQIWIERPDDELRARELLEAYRALASGPGRPCPACAEENPPAFELCWSCGKSLPP